MIRCKVSGAGCKYLHVTLPTYCNNMYLFFPLRPPGHDISSFARPIEVLDMLEAESSVMIDLYPLQMRPIFS